ncbi:MAG: uracil-DNA glycosylase [Alphaproteobacteria bacterium]
MISQDYANLKWLINSGADEAIADEPANRFVQSAKEQAKKIEKANPIAKPVEKTVQSNNQAPKTERPKSNITGNQDAIKNATNLANNSTSIADIEKNIAGFNDCSLKTTAKNTVYYKGDHNPDILCIGIAPNKNDDASGIAFSGDVETLTNRMFKAIDLDTSKIAYTNSMFWYPPGDRSITNAEFQITLPLLLKTIELAKPKIVIVFGTELTKLLFNQSFPQLRGKITSIKHNDKENNFFVLHSPKQMIKVPAYKKQVWADLQKLKKYLND